MTNKKYIAIFALLICLVGQAIAQPVMVEKSGRSAKTYYSSESGLIVDFNVGYVTPIGSASNVANVPSTPSFGINIGYGLNKNWKVAIGYQNANFQEDKGITTIKEGLYSVTGVTVESINFNNILANLEYTHSISQYVKPYASLSVGMSSVSLITDIANSFSMKTTTWMPAIAPQIGLRGYFDKGSTIGYNANISYNQYFGSIKNINHNVSSPSYLRFAAGVFVKIM